MPQINQLSPVSQVSSSDQIPVYATQNGDARKMSVSQLLDYFEESFVTPDTTVDVQTISPGAPGAYAVTPSSAQVIWFRVQPTGVMTGGATSIALPDASSTADGTEILITTSSRINTFAVTSLNANVFGVPVDMTANASVRLRLKKENAAPHAWQNITANSTSFAAPILGAATGTSLTLSGAMLAGGAVAGTTGTFSSNVSGVIGNFSGNVIGSAGVFSGAISGSSISTTGNQFITGPGKNGYTLGSGGSISQAITGSKASGVTLDKSNGIITLDPTGLIAAGGVVSFTLTNSFITATDVVIANYVGGTSGAYGLSCRPAAGSCVISIRNNTAGNLTEALQINFAVLNSVSA